MCSVLCWVVVVRVLCWGSPFWSSPYLCDFEPVTAVGSGNIGISQPSTGFLAWKSNEVFPDEKLPHALYINISEDISKFKTEGTAVGMVLPEGAGEAPGSHPPTHQSRPLFLIVLWNSLFFSNRLWFLLLALSELSGI